MTIELTALLAQAESAAARRRKAAEAEAAERAKRDLRDDRKRAVHMTTQVLELETARDDWQRLELPDELSSYASRTVWHPTDDDELRLAFRHRGVTDGGDVLTILALAPETGDWVASRYELTGLADLPTVVEDARRQAERWDASAAEEEVDLAGLVDGEKDEPAVTLSGESVDEILVRCLKLVAQRAATPHDA